MKILLLAALIAAAASNQLSSQDDQSQWPWQTGKVYRYDVKADNLVRMQNGPNPPTSGNSFKTQFVVRVKGPGKLQVRLENSQDVQFNQELLLTKEESPENLQYNPVQNLDHPFEIYLEGGRVVSMQMPAEISLQHENVLKGLVSALQVDLSNYRNIQSQHDNYDREIQQGMFRKMETDVTGDCETLYTVSPVESEWRRELTRIQPTEDPLQIRKAKNYGHCHHRVAYHFGVPNEAEWTGTASENQEEQFMRRSTQSRLLVGRQGTIYKSEVTSSVYVHPYLYGKQKVEALSTVRMSLLTMENDQEPQWSMPDNTRVVKNLLYSLNGKQVDINEISSEGHGYSGSKDRLPRAIRNPKIIAINKIIVQKRNYQDTSSESSSSSDSTSAYVNDNVPINDSGYSAVYMDPTPRIEKKQYPAIAQKVLQDLSQLIQNPNNLPKFDFLSKFNILVRVVGSMNLKQLTQTSQSIESGKQSNNKIKADMWMIFRDAVTEAGTVPAFQQIKSWIVSQKIQGEEAAEVVTTLANTMMYPTKEIMLQFFELATSLDVSKQQVLENAALLAVTKLMNRAHVNNETAHSYYPTHMYGRLTPRHDDFVYRQVLPRLQQNLELAVKQNQNERFLVYIKAIGNLGHRGIIEVFTPYLEGQIPITSFMRTQVIENLRVLAIQKDHYARAVLYSILVNPNEIYEARVAAVNNLFKSLPTSAMMLAMAQMTLTDPSIQVRAVLKSAILSAAELKNPHFQDLSRKAQEVRPMVTKEEFGASYSSKTYKDYVDFDSDYSSFSTWSLTGSEDSLLPKSFDMTLNNKYGGWNKDYSITASISSIRNMIIPFVQQRTSKTSHQFSTEKIAQMLNLKRDPEIPLEASIAINFMDQQRYFAFSENEIQQLQKTVQNYLVSLSNGIENHYTKVLNQAKVTIAFPVATGMPFIFKYRVPTLIHILNKVKGQIDIKDQKASIDQEMLFTFSRNVDGSVGFLNTLTDQYSSVGIVNKVQINLPFKTQIEMQSKKLQIRLEPMQPDQDTTIVHYSVWPYSAVQKKDTTVPVSLDTTTQLYSRQHKVYSIDTKHGQNSGAVYQSQGYSYSKDYRNFGNLIKSDIFATFMTLSKQNDIALTHYNLKYLGKQSPNKAVTFTLVYDQLFNQKQNGKAPNVPQMMTDVTPDSNPRRDELIKLVVPGINTANAQVIDLSAIFEGAQKTEYILSAAVAQSPVDPKIQYAFFAGRNSDKQGKSQINGVGNWVKPAWTSLNFLQSLEKQIKTSFETNVKFGSDNLGNIKIQGSAERTGKWIEDLKKSYLGIRCQKQISEQNIYQKECYKALVLAHAPDHIAAVMSYKDVSPSVRNLTYQAFRLAQHFGFWYTDMNPLKSSSDQVSIDVQNNYLEDTMNMIVSSKFGDLRVNDMPIPKTSAAVFSSYMPFNQNELINNYYYKQMYQPYCSIDSNKIKTFSNRAYDYMLTKSWHVVVHDDATYSDKVEKKRDQLVVLSRRPEENNLEVYISYKNEYGSALEVKILPKNKGMKPEINVNTDAKKNSEGDLTMFWDEHLEESLFQYFTHSDGVLHFVLGKDRLRAMYDGNRLIVLAKNNRNSLHGVCGVMSGDKRDDYRTQYGIVNLPEYYAASFALSTEDSDPKTLELQNKAKESAYQQKHQFTSILKSSNDWQVNRHSSSEENVGSENIYKVRSYLKDQGSCDLQKQVQYYENQGEICISTTPLDSCQSHCRGLEYKMTAVQVICRPKTDMEQIQKRDMIREGQNPSVSGVPKPRQFRVPSSCKA